MRSRIRSPRSAGRPRRAEGMRGEGRGGGAHVERRGEEGQEALAVDVDGQRLLADDVAFDLVQTTALELEIRAHGPIVPRPSGKAKGPPLGDRCSIAKPEAEAGGGAGGALGGAAGGEPSQPPQ